MIWDIGAILAAKRRAPGLDVLAFRTPPRPPGPARRRFPQPELIAGNASSTTPIASRHVSNGHFSRKANPQECPEP
jgi:hypothetical protein